jgi:hypothetical protein
MLRLVDLPAVLMLQPMIMAAHGTQVVIGGRPAVPIVAGVVGVCGSGGGATADHGAGSVADH